MKHAVCTVPVSPLRKEPSHPNEITSQLLFGETCRITEETHNDWVKITCDHDGYEGWCTLNQLNELPEDFSLTGNRCLVPEWTREVFINELPMHLPFGADISLFSHGPGLPGKYELGDGTGNWHPGDMKMTEEAIRFVAFRYLNTPYLWGGRTVWGVDCSGFVQMVYKFFGIALQRDAWQQATQGNVTGFLQEAKCGDLAFFDDEEGNIIHVGMMLDTETIIHASGKVRVDKIDNAGIIQLPGGQRTHRLRLIKRFRDDASL